MLLNYLKLSLRLLARNPFFTFINVAGLSIGFAVFFILWPFTQSELQSDQFIKDYERIARPISDFRWTDNGGESWGHLNLTVMPSHTGSEVIKHSAVEDVTRFTSQRGSVVTVEYPGQSPFTTKIDRAIIADRNFFEFFDLAFIYGAAGNALNKADGVAISQQTSISFFGGEDPVDKILRISIEV